jgi:predicted RNase H-like nuclease (RuvC/YqgF family)
MFDMYRKKVKKPVDPNAPPRPNLLNHEKRLKDATLTVDQLQQQNQQLQHRVEELERKMINQNAYLNQLHAFVTHKLKG